MPLKVKKRGEIWHYSGTIAGRRLRGSTGTAHKETAERIAAEIETKQWKRNHDGPQAVLTFAQAALLYRAAGKATRFLERVEDHWKDTLVKDITKGAIRQSAIVLYPTAAGATRNRQVIVPTQAIINHAAESDLCPHIRVKRFKTETEIKIPATLEWTEAFRKAAPAHLGSLALFMFLTGARITEALNVRWDDIDMEARTVLIRQSKLGNQRRAHLPQPLVVALANLGGKRPFKYADRSGCIKPWYKAVERAGIAPLSPHSCRHGFATALLRKGVDPLTVAKLGGWKSARHVFETYGHANEDKTLTDLISVTPAPHDAASNVRKPRKTGTS